MEMLDDNAIQSAGEMSRGPCMHCFCIDLNDVEIL